MRVVAFILIASLSSAVFAQTSAAVRPDASAKVAETPARQLLPPPAAPQHPAQIMQQQGGSLLKASLAAQPPAAHGDYGTVSFFAVPEPQPRVIRKHDLLTVIIREESSFSSEGNTDLKKEANLDARIEEFVRLSLAQQALKPAVTDYKPRVALAGSRDFKGEATVDRTDSLTARITAEVIDVKPNGTLVLQARKRIKTDDEEQQFILTGICRVEDVSADNTILSTQLHDQELYKTHKGAVRDTTKRGLIPKLLDVLNPF